MTIIQILLKQTTMVKKKKQQKITHRDKELRAYDINVPGQARVF